MPASYKPAKSRPSSGRRKRNAKERWSADQRLKSPKVSDQPEKDSPQTDLRLLNAVGTIRQSRARSDGLKERHTTRHLLEDNPAVRF